MGAGATPVRVTVVAPSGSLSGGAEQWLLSAIQHTEALRVRVVLLSDGELRPQLVDAGADVVVVPTGAGVTAIARTSRWLITELREHRPEVVLANGVKAQVVAALPTRLLRLPLVWVKHDHSYDAALARTLGRLSTLVVATALEVGLPTGRDDLVVIEPARPAEPLSRSLALAELVLLGYRGGEGNTLVMIGRLVPYKGVDIGIAALSYPAATGWRLVVIGDDGDGTSAELERLGRLAADLGVSDRVEFLGAVPGAGRLVGAFDALAVLTRPSVRGAPDREGYGISATEAMLAAVPVIVAGQGPIARRMKTGEGTAGLVVRPGDPLDTARALAALSPVAKRVGHGAVGRVVAAAQPDAEQVSDALVEVLRRAVGRVAQP